MSITTYTNAPEAYDYGYSTDTGIRIPVRLGASVIELREVESPEDMVTYQRDRYQSGFYMAMSFMALCEATPVDAA